MLYKPHEIACYKRANQDMLLMVRPFKKRGIVHGNTKTQGGRVEED